MALKMKFLETSPINAEDQIRYPVSYANGIFLRDGTRTVQDFIDSFNVNNGGDNSINLPSNCVNTSQINDLAITSEKIAAFAIIEGKIADNAITDAKVTSYNKERQIGGLSGSKLKDNAVTEDKIADNAVTTDKIADDTITKEKIFYNVFNLDFIATSDSIRDNLTAESGWIDLSEYHYFILGAIAKEDGRVLATTFVPVCAPASKTVSVGDPAEERTISIGYNWETEYKESSGSNNYHAYLQLRDNNGTLEGRIFIATGNWCLAGLWGF